MNDNRNYLIAIVLSLIVLFGWQYFVAQPRIEAEKQRRAAETQVQAPVPQPGQPPAPATPAAPPGAPAPATPISLTREAALAQSPRVALQTPSLSGSIALKGGRLDDLRLTRYHETVEPTSPTIVLLSPSGSPDPYYAEFGWVTNPAAPVKAPGADTLWTAASPGPLAPGRPVTLSWDNGEGLVFERTFAIDDKYMFTVTDRVRNTGDKPATLFPYSLISRHGTPKTAGFYILHEGLIGVFGEEGLKEVGYSELKDKKAISLPRTSGSWLGITDKYWATALVPNKDAAVQPAFRYFPPQGAIKERYQADSLGEALTLAPGAAAEASVRLFAGAKEVKTVDEYEAAYKIDRFDRLIDWGWFYWLTKPLFFLLDWFYKLFGNFGLAILAVTVVIKTIFFPLNNKSYASMSKMKKIQPEMKTLQERYKDDKAKLQQALMDLYRREKINPLAGCLPILVQIPVFFALYKVLFVTIEMRHAPFFGWIRDLSAPDPTTIFNLFGLIPWNPDTVPVLGPFLMLGVWPILMGLTMWVQMKMNPAPPDPTQKMIFDWMPFIFTFMLAAFPAGLVIYWAWNNFLSIIQQWVIMRRYGVPVELWNNVKGTFGKPSTPAT